MPPIIVRHCTRVRVREIRTTVVATSFLLALIVFSSLQAGARRLQKDWTTITGTRLWVSATLPQGKVGVAYVGALGVRGGVAPYKFTAKGSLPPGVTLNSSTGAFSGTPTSAGIFYFTASVQDSVGNVGDKKLSISIASASQITVQISPTSATVASGGTQQFSATVSGSSGVTWSTTAGSISSNGLLSAPTVTTTTYVTVTAASTASADAKASAMITVNPPSSTKITVSLNPTSATLTSGGAQQFAATVSGTSNTSVLWSTNAGSISSTGLLTAPAVTTATSVTITAKSAALLDSKAYASVTVNPPATTTPPPAISVSVTPGSPVVQTSGTIQFSASVSGSTNTAVTWKAGFGTISSSGLYTASSSGGTDTVIATSQADTTKAASAVVTVQSSTPQNTGGGGTSGGGTPNPSANAYCTSAGTWSGPVTDGPANLPVKCMYTAVSGTPSPGTVRGPDSSTTALQSDINAAACGDTILVAAGSSVGTITLPAKSCDNAHWITIQSTGVSNSSFPAEGVRMTPCWSGVASMPGRPAYACSSPQVLTFKVVTTGSSSGILVRGDHYRIIGAEITRVTTGGVPVYNLVDLSNSGTQTNNIILDRVWFHGVPGIFPSTSTSTDTSTTRGIYLGQSNHVAVIDSYFSDFYDTSSMSANGNTDAQCMAGGFGSTPNSGWGVYKFVNNHCEASGEGILIGGSSGPPLTPSGCTIMVNCNVDSPSDIEVRQNYFFKPLQWNGNTTTVAMTGWPVVKNGFEMKTGVRGLFEGNVIENCWYNAQGCGAFNVAPINQQSGGTSPVATCPTCVVTDFTYRYNYSYNTAYGIAVYAMMPTTCSTCQSQGANRVSIHDNVIGDNLNLGSLTSTSTGDAIEILATNDSTGRGLNKLQNVDINHNTFVKAIRSAILFGGPSDNTRIVNLTIQNNLWAYGNYGWVGVGGSGGCDQQANGIFYNALNNCVSNWTVDHNAVFNWNGGSTLGANWPTNGSGTGNYFVTGTSSLSFTSYGTGNSNFNPGNYALTSSSPVHNAASDGTDIGADINTVLSVISGVRQ
jgi:hypothetical protein